MAPSTPNPLALDDLHLFCRIAQLGSLSGVARERDVPVSAVMLAERHRLPKVRACVDYWVARFAAQSGASAAQPFTVADNPIP